MNLRGVRWWVISLIFLAAVLNYVDRQTLSVLAPTIQHDLGLDDQSYADVVNIFLVAYTLAYLAAGKITDRFGTRAGMGLFVVWWSIANMLTAAARGAPSLGVFRFMLGLGESGVWPAASKAVSEWFPPRERALAIGVYTMGATVGATVAPYVVIPLAMFAYGDRLPVLAQWLGPGTGWRMAFLLTGGAGLLWVVPWLWLYRPPRASRLVGADELRMIEEAQASDTGARGGDAAGATWSWGRVLTFKATWLLLLGRLLTDCVWYFFQFWFPKYLHTARGLAQEDLTITWIVYAAAGLGSIAGGWLSGRLVGRGVRPATSRLWIMLGCAAVMPLSALIPRVDGLGLAMTLTVVVVFASLAWLINISSIVIDVVPRHSVGTVFSVVAAGSTLGGIVMNMFVATLVSGPSTKPVGFLDAGVRAVFGGVLEWVQGSGYEPWFVVAAFLHPLALLVLWAFGVHRPTASHDS